MGEADGLRHWCNRGYGNTGRIYFGRCFGLFMVILLNQLVPLTFSGFELFDPSVDHVELFFVQKGGFVVAEFGGLLFG